MLDLDLEVVSLCVLVSLTKTFLEMYSFSQLWDERYTTAVMLEMSSGIRSRIVMVLAIQRSCLLIFSWVPAFRLGGQRGKENVSVWSSFSIL